MTDPLFKVMVPANALERCLGFLHAFEHVDRDTLVHIRGGIATDGTRLLVVAFGAEQHVLMVSEAKRMAQLMEEALQLYPTPETIRMFPDMILGLRAAVAKAEQMAPN